MSAEHEQAIRERAYAIWKREGQPAGRSLLHWLQAETEIGSERVVGVRKRVKCRPRKKP